MGAQGWLAERDSIRVPLSVAVAIPISAQLDLLVSIPIRIHLVARTLGPARPTSRRLFEPPNVPVGFEQLERPIKVEHGLEPGAALGPFECVSLRELVTSASGNPAQDVLGVGDPRIGTHLHERRFGVLGEEPRERDGALSACPR